MLSLLSVFIETASRYREALGIAASILVSVSLCMKHIKGLRIINLAGSAIFLCYGVLLHALSIILLNGFSVAVNVYYLLQMKNETTRQDLFDALFIDSVDDEILQRFVRFHEDDICRFNPSFNSDMKTGTLVDAECCFILRETLPVSLGAYKREENGEISILVDYVIPAYRDMKNAQFFFSNVVNRIAAPGSVFTARAEVKAHAGYLKRLGFIEANKEGTVTYFRKVI